MPQGTLTRILEEIKTLKVEENRQVQHALEAQLAPTAEEHTDDEFARALLDAGLISKIPRPDGSEYRERRLVAIQGEPLSETIIRERR